MKHLTGYAECKLRKEFLVRREPGYIWKTKPVLKLYPIPTTTPTRVVAIATAPSKGNKEWQALSDEDRPIQESVGFFL